MANGGWTGRWGWTVDNPGETTETAGNSWTTALTTAEMAPYRG